LECQNFFTTETQRLKGRTRKSHRARSYRGKYVGQALNLTGLESQAESLTYVRIHLVDVIEGFFSVALSRVSDLIGS
jgi:hypothetical protein